MVCSMMSSCFTTYLFWGYALEMTPHILNRVPTKKVAKHLTRCGTGKAPSLAHIKVWGCEAFVRRDTHDKLEPHSERCIFIGYPQKSFGYLFYRPKDNVVFVARRGVFRERELISQGDSGEANRSWRDSRVDRWRNLYRWHSTRGGNSGWIDYESLPLRRSPELEFNPSFMVFILLPKGTSILVMVH